MKHAFRLKQAIEDAVIAGQFAPGARLDEVSLAERFGVSRTPVREALLQLGAEGFIEMRPRRGAVVSLPSPQRLLEMFEMMAEIEAACGKYAARRLTAPDRAALIASHEECVKAEATGDSEAYYELNRAFHETVYRASRNSILAEQATGLHKRLSAYRRLQLRAQNRLRQSLLEHGNIVKAICDGDEIAAATLLRDHVLIQGERFSDLVFALSQMEDRAHTPVKKSQP